MITIGVVFGGPEHHRSDIYFLFQKISCAVEKLRKNFVFGSAPAVNVIYFLHGTLNAPDWNGLRIGKFSLKDKMVIVQVSTPKCTEAKNLLKFVVDSLEDAITLAAQRFDEKKMKFQTKEANSLINKIHDVVESDRK